MEYILPVIILIMVGYLIFALRKLEKYENLDSRIAAAVNSAWDEKMADAVVTLTSEDTLAQALARMDERQLETLADQVATIRGAK